MLINLVFDILKKDYIQNQVRNNMSKREKRITELKDYAERTEIVIFRYADLRNDRWRILMNKQLKDYRKEIISLCKKRK